MVLDPEVLNKDPKRFVVRVSDTNADKTPGPGNDSIRVHVFTVKSDGRTLLDQGNSIVL